MVYGFCNGNGVGMVMAFRLSGRSFFGSPTPAILLGGVGRDEDAGSKWPQGAPVVAQMLAEFMPAPLGHDVSDMFPA